VARAGRQDQHEGELIGGSGAGGTKKPATTCSGKGTRTMSLLKWALIFLVVSIIAGIFGFTGISAASADVARILFYLFVVIFLVLVVLGLTIFRA
jgi:uncharacterized membrane protein YtjA (UPF0391 family)